MCVEISDLVLIVDDDPAVLSILGRYMKQLDLPYRAAASGAEALGIVEFEVPQIMITDLLMPEMGGFELIERATNLNPDLQCIVLTGYGGLPSAIETFHQGAVDYLCKPVTLQEVERAIARGRNQLRLVQKVRHTEDRLRSTNTRLMLETNINTTLLNSIGDGIVGTDQEGRITFANPSAQYMLGWEDDRWLGQPLHDTIHPSEPDGSSVSIDDCAICSVYRAGTTVMDSSNHFRRSDGTSFPVESISTPMRNLDTLIGMVISFRDITERKRAETAEQNALAELEFHVQERTEELAQTNHRLQAQIRERQYAEARLREAKEDVESSNTRLLKEIKERKVAQKYLDYLAHHDSLTGLPNRFNFKKNLRRAMNRTLRSERFMALMIIDFDNFKNVNDVHGHSIGDLLLVEAVARMNKCIRKTDSLARVGGDEFFCIVENLQDEAKVRQIASRIIEALTPVFDLKGNEARIGASIGISLFPNPNDEMDDNSVEADPLIKAADLAMYLAKEYGGNQYQFYTRDLENRIRTRIRMQDNLATALERNEFEVHYQPQVDTRTRQVVGVEALLRWNSPDRGIVLPDVIIPPLEESGLIKDVGTWVLNEACRQGKIWQEKGLADLTMSVNLSPCQFVDEDLAQRIDQTLSRTGFDAAHLDLEITETLFLQENPTVHKTLDELSDIGTRVIMDDFGTGYSSLSYLKHFPISGVKIDRVFTQGLLFDKRDEILVNAIIAMGQGLGLPVILAEGVEEKAQMEMLRDKGCHLCQGHLFGKPAPPDQVEQVLFN